MCGIVGYVGDREAEPILLEGLRRLEYRGYDSAGAGDLDRRPPAPAQAAGRIADLVAAACATARPPGCIGISHTRWATHGPANDVNAHPHVGGDGAVAVVHNGVIENYAALKRQLAGRGRRLPQRHRHRGHRPADRPPPATATWSRRCARRSPLLKGTYGLAVVSPRFPGLIVGARLGSPLVLGIGEGEHFLASDPGALVGNTDKVVYLQDDQMCVLTPDDWHILDRRPARGRRPRPRRSTGTPATPTRAASSTTCSRRSTSSPRRWRTPCAAGSTTPTPRAHFGGLNLDTAAAAPGRAHHPDRLRHQLPRRPWSASTCSRTSPACRSRSSTPASSATATRPSTATPSSSPSPSRARRPTRWPPCASPSARATRRWRICNVVGSTIAREADGGVYLHAGPEIGVASTKAFTVAGDRADACWPCTWAGCGTCRSLPGARMIARAAGHAGR